MFVLPVALLAALVSGHAQPVIQAVFNAASFEPGIAPGSLITIYGTKLAELEQLAPGLPLPGKLGETTVKAGDLTLPLYYVSPNQINAQLPYEVKVGEYGQIELTVSSSQGTSAKFKAGLYASAPALFTRTSNGRGHVLSFDPGFHPSDTPQSGDYVVVYATGLGVTEPPAITGAGGAGEEPFNRAVNVPEVLIGEQPADILYAGLAPGMAGVYQLNLRVNGNASDRMVIRAASGLVHAVELPVIQGQPNVVNVSGSIEPLSPGSEVVSFSPVFLAARIAARFDILPVARPFTLAATGEAGSLILRFDPSAGTYEGYVTVPTPATRAWDFSAAGLVPVDFLAAGMPVPGAIVPISRVPPSMVRSMSFLPMPNTAGSSAGISTVRFSGTARAGSTFTISSDENAELSAFGGWLSLGWPQAFPTRTSTFRLYVDGKLIASKDLTYPLVP